MLSVRQALSMASRWPWVRTATVLASRNPMVMLVQVRFLTAQTKKVLMACLMVGPSASQASTSAWTHEATVRPWMSLNQARNLMVSVISCFAL